MQNSGAKMLKEVVQTLTEEFVVNLGSGLRWEKQTVPCLKPVTDVLQLLILWAQVQVRFVIACTVPCAYI